MHRGAKWPSFVALLLASASPAWVVAAETTPELLDDLDGDGRAERIHQSPDGAIAIDGAGGATWSTLPSPLALDRLGPPSLRVVRSGGLVYLEARNPVRADAGGTATPRTLERIGLVEHGGVRVVYDGVTGPEGRDGERAEAVRLDERGVLRYQTAPGVTRCDGDDVLFPALYDVASGRFRAVAIAPPTPGDGAPPIEATATLPDFARAAPLGLFRYVAASTQRGDEGRADRLAPPRALDDGRLDTAWTEGMAGPGRGAFVTARAVAPGQEVVGIELVAAPGNAVRRLALHAGRWLRVDLGDRAVPGRPLWIPLPKPVAADCITLALDEVERRGAADDTSLAEADVYTTLDRAPGGVDGPQDETTRSAALDELVRRVRDGGRGSDALAQVVATHGRDAVAAVVRALPGTSGEARRRLLELLAATNDASAELVAALATADVEERRLIGDALSRDGRIGGGALAPDAALLRLVNDPSVPAAARLEAIGIFGRVNHGTRVATLLWPSVRDDAFAGRPALREAAIGVLIDASTIGGTAWQLLPEVVASLTPPRRARDLEAAIRVAAQVAAKPSPATGDAPRPAPDVALGAVPSGRPSAVPTAARAEVEQALARLGAEPTTFGVRFQLLRAARTLGAPTLWPVVAAALADTDEVLRWAAVEAAAVVPGEAARSALEHAVADGDPRVRVTALQGLARGHDSTFVAAAAHVLDDDAWPVVRRVAAEGLAAACPDAGAQALRRAVLRGLAPSHRAPDAADGDEAVRRAALVALARCDAALAAPLALHLVPDDDAPHDLREQAAALLATLHPAGAGEALGRALADVLTDGSADERGAAFALALVRALSALEDRDAEPVLLAALKEPELPALRAAAAEAVGHFAPRCTRTVTTALATAATDTDATVRRAVDHARARCAAAPSSPTPPR